MNPYILAQLKRDEGFVGRPYLCTAGHTTIGYGRNLDANPLTPVEGEFLLTHDVQHVEAQAIDSFPWFPDLDEARQAVVLSMIYNLGLDGFRGFGRTIQAIAGGHYDEAADRMLASLWARQVKGRATRLATIMRTGVVP